MRLSQAELVEVDGALDLAAPFVTVAVTNPCITFSSAGLDTPFEGLFSGGRIARLAPDQVLWSTGDHGWIGLDGYPAVSQEDASSLGKLLRVNLRDKTVATFAKGFRNPQGLTIDSSGRVWVTDHGPRGGDRLVLAQEGGNYGWPFATYGTDYGPQPWPFNAVQGRPAFGDQPKFVWVPSIATSAVFEASSEMFKLWQGDLLVLSLAGNSLHRLRLENDRVIYDEPILFSGYRLRAVTQMPNGQFAMLADNGTVIVVRNADPFRQSPYLDARTQQRRRSDQMSAEERTAAISRRVTQDPTLASGLTLPRLSETEEQGRAVFVTQCSPCHAIDTPEPRIGPSLMNVVGRRVGATTFGYSAALSGRASEVWTAERIVQFAQAPSSVFTGSAMPAVPLTPIQHTQLKTFLARLSQN
jgi:cytochrome c2